MKPSSKIDRELWVRLGADGELVLVTHLVSAAEVASASVMAQ